MEYVRKCKVCGKVYCYTDADVSRNKMNSINAGISAVGTIASVLGGGSMLTSAYLNNQTDKYGDKVVDYTKCPNCNSTRTVLIEENNDDVDEILGGLGLLDDDADDILREAGLLITEEDLQKDVENNKRKALSYFANESKENKRNERKREKEIRKRDIQEYINEVKISLEKTQTQIEEQRKIIEANKGKLFGAGAKEKKEAQRKLAELESTANTLLLKKKDLKNALYKEMDFLDKIGLDSKQMAELPSDMAGIINRLEELVGLPHEKEDFIEIYSKKRFLYSENPVVEYATLDFYVNEERLFIHQVVKDRTWNFLFDDLAIIFEFSNLSLGIREDIKILDYKYITRLSYDIKERYTGIWGDKGNYDFVSVNLPSDIRLANIAIEKLREKVEDKKVLGEIESYFLEYEKIKHTI